METKEELKRKFLKVYFEAINSEDSALLFDLFRSGLFRASLEHYLETGTVSGNLALEAREMFSPPSEASEQKSVVTQSEKGEMIEEIWEKIIYTQHVESGDEAYIIEKDDFIKAMQEYALHSKQQARVEAIQECIEIVEEIYKPLLIQNIPLSEAIKELENLKSRQ